MDDYFQITEKDGLRLIVPSHSSAGVNNLWNRDNVWLRSRLETLSGELVSQGWGKFTNLGQGSDSLRIELQDVLKGIKNRDAFATLKYDGSALYFSSYGDQKIVRTRGSHSYIHLDNAQEIEELRIKYPTMFDPNYMRGFTLLCEFCTPSQQIVIRYPEPTLVLIGAVDHARMRYLTLNELAMIAATTGVKLVENFALSPNNWEELYSKLETDHSIEGYVIRLDKEQRLAKIKCVPYLVKHSLKSNLTSEKLAEMWLLNGCPDFNGFMDIFKTQFDEETAMWALPAISNLMEGVKIYNKIISRIQDVYEQNKLLSRKDYAILMRNQYGDTKKFGVAMNLYLGKENTRETLKHILLQNVKQIEMGMFKKTI